MIAALGANLGIALIKFVAFAITASTSLLAEGVHSLVDSGNQVLLLIGGKRSRRQATAEHPFGYGRDRYVYGFLVALILFSAGGLFALYEGIHKILHPHPLESPIVAFAVLALAIILESFSLRTAVAESRPLKGDSSWPQFIRRAKVPELPVVLLEDVAALVGLVLALTDLHRRLAHHGRCRSGHRDEEPVVGRIGFTGNGRGDRQQPDRARCQADHSPAHNASRSGGTVDRRETRHVTERNPG